MILKINLEAEWSCAVLGGVFNDFMDDVLFSVYEEIWMGGVHYCLRSTYCVQHHCESWNVAQYVHCNYRNKNYESSRYQKSYIFPICEIKQNGASNFIQSIMHFAFMRVINLFIFFNFFGQPFHVYVNDLFMWIRFVTLMKIQIGRLIFIGWLKDYHHQRTTIYFHQKMRTIPFNFTRNSFSISVFGLQSLSNAGIRLSSVWRAHSHGALITQYLQLALNSVVLFRLCYLYCSIFKIKIMVPVKRSAFLSAGSLKNVDLHNLWICFGSGQFQKRLRCMCFHCLK